MYVSILFKNYLKDLPYLYDDRWVGKNASLFWQRILSSLRHMQLESATVGVFELTEKHTDENLAYGKGISSRT